MAELDHEEILQDIAVTDEKKVRARNYVLGRFGFTRGERAPSRFPLTREMLEALGLDWKLPPGTPSIKAPLSVKLDPKDVIRSRNSV